MNKKLAAVCALCITAVALVTYQPGLKIGFLDGWWYLEWVGTMDLPRYIIQFLDPRNVTQGYRPVQGLYVLVQYLLWQFNSDGYHLAHTVFHAANSILLLALVGRLGKNSRVAIMAALIYVVSPVYSLAIFWHAVVDPLSAFFYLLTLLLWTVYEETRRPLYWVATYVAFLFALFSKEVAVFIPLLLFLIERWFYHRKPGWREIVRHYALFLIVFIPFGLLELNVQSHGEFVGQFKFSFGPHMLGNLMPYLAVLAFPWTADLPTGAAWYIWLAIAFVVYSAVMAYKRSTVLLFLALVAVLNIVPLLGFPLEFFNTRYLYTSIMVSAILIAMLIYSGWQALSARPRLRPVLAALAVVLITLASGARIADAASGLAEFTRQLRVPFRDISRQHPTFPPDSYLYFVYSPATRVVDFEGLSFVRYGAAVKVDGTDTGNRVELREHNAAYVYYFDAGGRPIELPVDPKANTRSTPTLPVQMAGPIRLDRYQVPGTLLERGKALVVILDWSTETKPDGDLTVFGHLVNADGQVVASYDSRPQQGQAPTNTWERGHVYVDVLVVPIPADAPPGDNYRLEVGLYDAVTLERLAVAGAGGAGDTVVIEPFRILP